MKIALIISVIMFTVSSIASAETLPKPPFFMPDANPIEILEQYPLGVISKYAAALNHGKADEELSLPNGLTGWKYIVGGMYIDKTYKKPSGEEINVKEVSREHTTKTYILVFNEDVVIDVLYHGEDRNKHITALLAQVLKKYSLPTR
jgi:hypothetical protein